MQTIAIFCRLSCCEGIPPSESGPSRLTTYLLSQRLPLGLCRLPLLALRANLASHLPKDILPMKIVDIRLTGLRGGTVQGGWANELKADDDLHTIVEVLTDDGLVGVGSVYTSKALTQAAV